MKALEFFQDKGGYLSAGRFAAVIGGVILGGVYIVLHPSDANLSAYLWFCAGCFTVSKGWDTLSPALGGKDAGASS